jgi:GTP-binding protein Era
VSANIKAAAGIQSATSIQTTAGIQEVAGIQTAPGIQEAPAEPFRSGFVTLVGRPNAGKSTLINAVLGRKLLITSNTAQTTRHRFRAVLDGTNFQLILVDTPGLHKPQDLLGKELNSTAANALKDVDMIAWVLDAMAPLGGGDRWVAELLRQIPLPRILVVNKADIASKDQLQAQLEAATALLPCDEVITLSALQRQNVQAFIDAVVRRLPPGPQWFVPGTSTDQPLEVVIAEFIREKVLLNTFDEVPHAVGVVVGELEFLAKRHLYRIAATIYVERESQKGIIVGKGGEQIRKIGSAARQDLEHFLAAQVYLDLRVKLRKGWRRDLNLIHRFGYGENIQ